jgi:hypothetical protein
LTTDVVAVAFVGYNLKFLNTGTVLQAMRVHTLNEDGIFSVAVKLETTRKLFYIPQADCLELNWIFLEDPAPCAT